MKKITLSIFIVLANLAFSQSRAVYNITFESVWNNSDHGTLPSGAHWSDLVGATHNSSVVFLEMGQPATPGIEDVAELGSNGAFFSEVQTAIGDENADRWIQESVDPFAAIASATISNIEVSENYPLLTLASMIAPSPDWMIAVNSVNLRPGGDWANEIVIDLFPYDAGTEDGFGYSISNPATNPRGVITNIAGASGYPFNSNKIGTLTIELLEVLSVETFENETSITVYPNPTANWISLSYPNSIEIETLELYNVLGKRVLKTNTVDSAINLSSLNDGIYIAKFYTTEGKSLVKKIIKR